MAGGGTGAKWAGLFLALVLCLSAATAAQGMRESRRYHGRRRSYRGEGQGERKFRLEEPRERFESEGGHVRVWDNFRAFEENDVYVRSARITLRERGLALPKYDDAACIGYVEEGEGLVGFLSGYSLGETVRRVRRGDVVAFPRGVAHWWYNTGNQELRILGFADTSAGLIPGEFTAFTLVGGGRGGKEEGSKRYHGQGEAQRELRSILHGFRKEFLAAAWNVDVQDVEEVLESQPGVGIVRAERDIDLSELPGSGTYQSRRQRRRDDEPKEVNAGAAAAADSGTGALQAGWGREHEFSRGLLGDFPSDFVYNVREATPDVFVENAGRGVVVDKTKLPLLSYVKLGMSYARLEGNALMAPHWSPTGHRMLHFLRGTGHIEIAGVGGRREVSTQVKEGDAFIIPRFFPAGIKAGDEGLEFITFYTTDVPYIESLAGETSVYNNLPTKLAAAAFNVDEEKVRECRRRSARAAILLPPPKHQGGRHELDTLNKIASM